MDYTFPTIGLSLSSLKNFQDRELATRVINTICEFDKDFLPSKYDINDPLTMKFNPQDIGEAVDLWMNDKNIQECNKNEYASGMLLLKAYEKSKASYMVIWYKKNEIHFNAFFFSANIEFLQKQNNFRKFMDLCIKLIILLEPVHGKIINESFPGGHEGMALETRLPELQWMNFFGQPYIDLFGREKLLSSPACKIELIGDNLIALQTTEDVFSPIPNDIREKIKRYLGENAFMWDGKRSIAYKNKENLVPEFDFSNVLFDKTKPIIVPQPRRRQVEISTDSQEEQAEKKSKLKAVLDDWSNSAFGLAKILNIELDYSVESVEKVEQLCEATYQFYKSKPEIDMKSIDTVSRIIGSFLGELIIRNIGGEWKLNKNKVITVSHKNFECYPLGKITKRLLDGSQENIVSYYNTCKKLMT
jgi:hypothetical protein